MDSNKKIPADMHAFMRELIQEVLGEQRMVNEWVDFDLKMFATQGDLSDILFKAELAGKLEAVYNKLKEKLSGGAREEAIDYFYSFIQSNRDSLQEEFPVTEIRDWLKKKWVRITTSGNIGCLLYTSPSPRD